MSPQSILWAFLYNKKIIEKNVKCGLIKFELIRLVGEP